MTIKSLTGPARPGVSLDDGSTEKFKVFCRPPQTRNNNNNLMLKRGFRPELALADHLNDKRPSYAPYSRSQWAPACLWPISGPHMCSKPLLLPVIYHHGIQLYIHMLCT